MHGMSRSARNRLQRSSQGLDDNSLGDHVAECRWAGDESFTPIYDSLRSRLAPPVRHEPARLALVPMTGKPLYVESLVEVDPGPPALPSRIMAVGGVTAMRHRPISGGRHRA